VSTTLEDHADQADPVDAAPAPPSGCDATGPVRLPGWREFCKQHTCNLPEHPTEQHHCRCGIAFWVTPVADPQP
jgi:hypothetical protein